MNFNEEMRWAIDLMSLAFNLGLWSQGGSYSNKKGEGKKNLVYLFTFTREIFERAGAREETTIWRELIPENFLREREKGNSANFQRQEENFSGHIS